MESRSFLGSPYHYEEDTLQNCSFAFGLLTQYPHSQTMHPTWSGNEATYTLGMKSFPPTLILLGLARLFGQPAWPCQAVWSARLALPGCLVSPLDLARLFGQPAWPCQAVWSARLALPGCLVSPLGLARLFGQPAWPCQAVWSASLALPGCLVSPLGLARLFGQPA